MDKDYLLRYFDRTYQLIAQMVEQNLIEKAYIGIIATENEEYDISIHVDFIEDSPENEKWLYGFVL